MNGGSRIAIAVCRREGFGIVVAGESIEGMAKFFVNPGKHHDIIES